MGQCPHSQGNMDVQKSCGFSPVSSEHGGNPLHTLTDRIRMNVKPAGAFGDSSTGFCYRPRCLQKLGAMGAVIGLERLNMLQW